MTIFIFIHYIRKYFMFNWFFRRSKEAAFSPTFGILTSIIVLVLVLIWLGYKYVKLIKKRKLEPILQMTPNNAKRPSKFDRSLIPRTVGSGYTISIWIWVDDWDTINHRGGAARGPQTAPQTAAQTAPRQPQDSPLWPHLLKPHACPLRYLLRIPLVPAPGTPRPQDPHRWDWSSCHHPR